MIRHPRCWLALLGACSMIAGLDAAAALPADATRGALIYERCAGCHALTTDRTGPRHCGLFGRRAGSVPGFAYSPAMRRSKIVWNTNTLDRFLRQPTTTIPGTAMGYDGIKDEQERTDLIAYLRAANERPPCRPN